MPDNSTNNYQDQLATAQAEIAQYKTEIARLQQALDERTEEVNKLIQWLQSLQQDIMAVYTSITWQVGNLMTRIALKLLRRPVGPTAQDHINKIIASFESWKINYVQSRRLHGLQKYIPWHDTREYALWIKQYDTLTPRRQAQLQAQMRQWQQRPLISLLMPVSHREEQWLRQAIESIQNQLYPDWELYLINQGIATELLTVCLHLDDRISLVVCPPNNSLVTALNTAVNLARGEFITIIGAADQLSPQALYKIAETIHTFPDNEVIYSDEDTLDADGRRSDPYFKSDWNPDLFYSQNFLRHLTVYRRTRISQVGGFRADYPGYEDYDLTLRVMENIRADQIRHIPQVLYHQRQLNSPLPTSTCACQALQAHFQRLHQAVTVVEAVGGHTRVIYPLPTNPPLVSLIIPTRDKLDLLRGTVEGILTKTDYPNIEVIIMDNGSVEPATLAYFKALQQDKRATIIRQATPFNYSQLNNIGVTHATGTLIGLINNDLEVINSDWLTEMVSHALRPEIGAVGAKLYYGNDTLQHAGVIVGLGGMAGHGFKYLAREAPGYHWKPFLIQNYSVVTGACLVMRRQVFQEVGGLEEKHLKVAFNDVDLCLRLRERGYRIVWTPYAELYHLESASRGADNTIKKYLRLRHELNYMKNRWGKELSYDPYYNPNLTIEYEDFALAWPPRVEIN